MCPPSDPASPPMSLETLTVEVSHLFHADPDTVFALLSDVQVMAGLGPEHTAVSGVRQPLRTGDGFVGHNSRGRRRWQVPCTVHVYDPPHAFGWVVGDIHRPTATWTYHLAPTGTRDGTTTVRQTFTHGPGRSLLRTACEGHPHRADEFVAARAEELRVNMATVLEAAADITQQPASQTEPDQTNG